MPDRIQAFLSDFTEWVSAQDDIRGAVLVGSQARNTAREDSDVDLVIVATKPDKYLRNTEWTQRYGTIERQQVEDYGKLTSLRVRYVGGLEIEYGLTDETWAGTPIDKGTAEVLAGGVVILLERDSILSRLKPNTSNSPNQSSSAVIP